MIIKNKIYLVVILLFSACSDYDYYSNYTNYRYSQVLKFADKNRIIKTINYENGVLIETPDKNVFPLKLSPNESTNFTVSDGVETYEFEIWMKFKDDNSQSEAEGNIYRKILESINIVKSTAPNARIVRQEVDAVSGSFYYNRTINVIDTLFIQ